MGSSFWRLRGVVMFWLSCLLVGMAAAQEGGLNETPLLPLKAESALLIDVATGTVLFEKNAYQRRFPASLTKVMTAILILERGKLDDVVTVRQTVKSVGESSAGLKVGERIRLRDLLQLMLIRSANDAAFIAAEHIAGSEEAFVSLMNQRAKELGAQDTHFVNTHGLHSPNHYSTAWDLAVMTLHALQNPLFRQIVATKKCRIEPTNKSALRLFRNRNKLLWHYPGCDGVKTGYTVPAGRCLIATATRNGWQLLSVVLKSPDHFADAKALLDYGFENFAPLTLAEAGQEITHFKVPFADVPQVAAIASETLRVVVGSGQEGLIRKRVRKSVSSPPVQKGQHVGWLEFDVPGRSVHSIPLIAAQDVGWSPAYLWRKRLFFAWGVIAIMLGCLLAIRMVRSRCKRGFRKSLPKRALHQGARRKR